MKASLQPGVSFERRLVVDRGRTIGFMGEEGRVYSTPDLVRDIEHCCRDLLLQHLDEDEDSVGTAIAVQHTAPTLPDMAVVVKATVTAVKGRLVELDVTAEDEVEPIAKGTHSRFIVERAKTVERLRAKDQKRKNKVDREPLTPQ
ncbi:MAG: LysR family transcriptional regulator [Rhodospirillales bacterium]|nr:LysR family transcriptional regulator [Rhodospirillales bacterium]